MKCCSLPTGRQQSCGMSSPKRSGTSFERCSLPSRAAYPAWTIGAFSMASSGYCDLARPGGIFQPIYGPRTTCYNRFVRWRRAGIWDSIMQALTAAQDATVQMIDTSMVRVHQHAACIADSGNQAIGRSRGGLTSKLHVVVDGKGLPLRLGITAGQAHDNRSVQRC